MLLEKWYGSNWRLGKKHQHNMERGNGQRRLWGGSDMWLWPQRMSPWQPSFEDASQREERHSGRINTKEAPKGMVYEGEISNHLVLWWYIKHKASSSKRWGWRGRWIPDFGNPCKDMFIYYNFSFSKMHVFFFTSIFLKSECIQLLLEETCQLPGEGGGCDEMDTACSLVWELNHADNFIQLDHFSSQLH